MLGFFRRIINSRVGMIVTFITLGLIAFAFAAGDVTGLRSGSGGVLGSNVARVGGDAIGEAQFKQQLAEQLNAIRQENPSVDMPTLVANGGVENVLDQMITARALEKFGRDQGMLVSRALVGSELQSIPALQGPTGKFDQAVYERILQQRRMTDAQVQGEIAQQAMARFLIAPTIGASQVPGSLALPYASLLLERRAGEVALIPAASVAPGAAASDADLRAFYQRNVARYSLPERRVIRYAKVTPDMVKAQARPTEAEIAQGYAADRAKYAAKERRAITQITVLDQKAGEALAAKVRAGGTIADAARAAGLEPRTFAGVDKAEFARQASPAAADAVFAAAKGAVVGPVRGGLGFIVAKVDSIEQVPGKSLAQARDEIAATLANRKTIEAIGKLHDVIDDAIAGSANFSELVADHRLTAQTTPALSATGANPDDPAARPDPALMPMVNAAFAAEDGDAPTLVQLTPDGSFAIVVLDRIIRAAPRPFEQVRAAVTKDFDLDRARKAARDVAGAVLARVQKGVPLAQALAAANVKGPPIQKVAAARAQITADPRGVNPALALLFSIPGGTARMLEAPNNAGWMIVKVDSIVPGDAAKVPGVVTATRRDLGRVIGREYTQQFTEAVKAAVKVERNPAEIARLKADLSGQGGSNK